MTRGAAVENTGGSAVAPYLPRLLLEWDAESAGPHLETSGTLVLADVTGFTRLSDRLALAGKRGAEEMTDILNAAFSGVLAVVEAAGGDVLKFGGDALLVLYTGPDHITRAAAAAHHQRRALAALQDDIATPVEMSVGVSTGGIHAFLAGTTHRELIVVGTAVDEAVRLQTQAGGGDILLDPATAAGIPDHHVSVRNGSRSLESAPDAPDHPVSPLTQDGDLTRFVPPQLRAEIAATLSEGEHRPAAIGFIEFAGIGELSETDGPRAVSDAMEGLVASAQEASAEHAVSMLGSDVAIDGGRLILSAGVPERSDQNDEEMLRTLRTVADDEHPGLDVGAGVARGRVFATDLGVRWRRTFTVIGDTVNLASLLASVAQPGQVLATAKVLDRSRTLFATDRLAPMALKGKTKPVAPFTVGEIIGLAARRGIHRYDLVGRDDEFAALLDVVDQVRAGTGAAVEIRGEAGIGKTRLVEELVARASDLDSYLLICEQYEANTPYYVLNFLLRTFLAVAAETDAAEVEARLRAFVAERAPDLEPWLPLLGTPLGLDLAGTPEVDALDADFRTRAMHDAVTGLVDAAIAEPSIVIVEDAHWLDDASRSFLARLAGSIEDRPVMLCVVSRPEDTDFELPGGSSVVDLTPLETEGTIALLSAAAHEAPVPEHVVAEIAARSGGHPLFALELLRAGTEAEGPELPETIEAVVAGRIDQLPPADRRMLRYASVLGQQFALSLLNEAVPGTAPSSEDVRSWERLSEFLDISPFGTVMFRHALLRDVAYEGLPFRRRLQVHGAVGDMIERKAGEEAARQAELLSYHYERAERYDKAWDYAASAGGRAQAAHANLDAATLYRRALRAVGHLEGADESAIAAVAEGLGDVSNLVADFPAALDAYENAATHVGDVPVASARLLRKQGEVRTSEGAFDDALSVLGEGLVLLQGLDDREAVEERIGLELAVAGTHYRQGNYDKCVSWCRRAIGEAEGSNDQAGTAHGYYLLFLASIHLGESDTQHLAKTALAIYEELDDPVGQAKVLTNLGLDTYYRGLWDDALEQWEQSRLAYEQGGDVVGAATAVNNLGEVYSDQGKFNQAESAFRQALWVWRAAKFPIGVALATSNLGRLMTRTGDYDHARRLLEDAMEGFMEIHSDSFVLEARSRLAELALVAGEVERSATEARELRIDAELTAGQTVLMAMLERILGVASWHQGDTGAAARHLEASVRLAEEAEADFELAQSLVGLGRLRHPGGASSAEIDRGERILIGMGAERCFMLPLPD